VSLMKRSSAATTAAASSSEALGATIRSWGRRLTIGGAYRLVLLAPVVLMLLAVPGPAQAAARPPALFRVGAAARSINPPVPVFSGGFSLSPPITHVHDPLQVRAFYVSNGHRAVGFAVIDAQGYFSAYQEGPNFGSTADRSDAARAASSAGGVRMAAGDIIVQATHTHAGPTLEGIWGPVPRVYLRLVHNQVVAALAAAARHARSAHLQFATLDDRNIAGVNINQDNYQGWINDPQISVLRAVSPSSGRTIGVFANIPTHGAHIRGDQLKLLSADYFGAVRATLDRELGGVSVVGPASLGRLESPVETTGTANMRWLSRVVANDVLEALGHAHWITSSRIAGSQQMVQIPASNAALLALNDAWALPDAQKQQEAAASGIYPIDRADTPPYRTGNVLGTWLTALRIGNLAFTSMPGEPFPEVRLTIARAAHAQAVVALSKGQDDFGYFFPSYDYVFPEVYNSDHALFSVAPEAGDEIIQDQVTNLSRLGFRTDPALEKPLPNSYAQKLKPGLQTMASPPTGDAGRSGRFTTTLQAIYMPASVRDAPLAGRVHWNFGDGTQAKTGYLSVGQDFNQTGQGVHSGPARFTHSFGPGTYRVVASARDTQGNPVFWTITVRVFPRLGLSCTGRVRGGEGTILRRVRRGHSITVLDAAGGRASAPARCRRKRPPLVGPRRRQGPRPSQHPHGQRGFTG
jgi:hypothetical protein